MGRAWTRTSDPVPTEPWACSKTSDRFVNNNVCPNSVVYYCALSFWHTASNLVHTFLRFINQAQAVLYLACIYFIGTTWQFYVLFSRGVYVIWIISGLAPPSPPNPLITTTLRYAPPKPYPFRSHLTNVVLWVRLVSRLQL